MFYVPDARTEVDEKGRPVISAQDFVEEHGIGTVFGFGGAYMLERSYLAMIFFCREAVGGGARTGARAGDERVQGGDDAAGGRGRFF